MGAIRINFTDGTSYFIDLSTAASASISDAQEEFTRIQAVDLSNNTTDWNIVRFDGTPQLVWPKSLKLAYEAIASDPIEYGYPNLSGEWQKYLKFDIAKFANSAIAQALDGDQSIDVVYSERTAIATDIVDVADAETIEKTIDKIKDEGNNVYNTVLTECNTATNAGNNYDCSPEGGIVEPLNGGQNDAGCAACAQAKKNLILKEIGQVVGNIDWKHQYLFKEIGGGN